MAKLLRAGWTCHRVSAPDQPIMGRKKARAASAGGRTPSACRALSLALGRMVPDGDLGNSMQPSRATIGVTRRQDHRLQSHHERSVAPARQGKAPSRCDCEAVPILGLRRGGVGEGVSLNGTVVPIELVTYVGGSKSEITHSSTTVHPLPASLGQDRLYCSTLHIRDGQQPARCRQAYGIAESDPVIIEDYVDRNAVILRHPSAAAP
jgi:hypothetical protein